MAAHRRQMKRRRGRKPRAAFFVVGLALAALVVFAGWHAASGQRAAVVAVPAQTQAATPSPLPSTAPAEEAHYDEVTDPAFTGYPEINHFEPDEVEVEMLARMIWGEARGVVSDMEKAACVWCVLNRVDNPDFPDTVAAVLTQPRQFAGYSPEYPATEELKAIAADVLTRWAEEQAGAADVGRVLPAEYLFFTGDGKRNHFRTEYRGGAVWDWSLKNPYND